MTHSISRLPWRQSFILRPSTTGGGPEPILSNVLALHKDSAPEVEEWARGHLVFEDADGVTQKCYDIVDDLLIMPRGAWQVCPFTMDVEDRRSSIPADMPEPKMSLRNYQQVPVSKMLKKGQGVLRAPTGSGKTVCLLYLAAKLKQRTLILVHTKDLMQQWADRCEAMLGFTPGMIGGGIWEEHDLITIGMVQTLMRYEQLPSDWVHSWGTVIIDEAHRAPASSFTHVISQMTAKYLFGATATPTRRDGNHPMMHFILGPVIASIKEDSLVSSGQLLRPQVEMIETSFYSAQGVRVSFAPHYQKQQLYTKMTHDLSEDKDRAMVIARKIVKLRGHHQLVLSKRIKHLELINQCIAELDPMVSSFVLTGGIRADERAEVLRMVADKNITVLLSTQLADEGLDLPVLDVLHLTFPGRGLEKLQQQVGRVMRTSNGKNGATVYDYVDTSVPVLRGQANHRWQWYKERGCEIHGWAPAGKKNTTGRGKRHVR